ncbi:trace amine-associated receptor 1-like [Amphiura filiformis]|uniref:trace amine-associated receptor 1-like n=1 Tax=Amphiura filiformis TaxID=82378 RepID=UPI003B20D1CC
MFSNNTSDSSPNSPGHLFEPITQTGLICIISSLFVIMIAGISGNLLILLSITRNACLQTPTYALVANLAVLDILNSAVVVPSMIISIIYGSLRKPVPCNIFGPSVYFMSIASLQTMTFISIDRYVAVTDPLKYHLKMTKNVVALILSWTWLLPIIACYVMPFAAELATFYYNDALLLCLAFLRDLRIIIPVSLSSAVIPFAVMLFCYLRIFLIARAHIRKLNAQIPAQLNNNQAPRKSAIKAAKVLLIVTGAFFLCFIPVLLVAACFSFNNGVCTFFPIAYQRACMTLSRLNCLINPIIYGVFNRKMREAFRKLVCQNCSTMPRALAVPSSTEIHP